MSSKHRICTKMPRLLLFFWLLASQLALSLGIQTNGKTQEPRCTYLPVDTVCHPFFLWPLDGVDIIKRDIANTNYFHLAKSLTIETGTTYRYIISRPSEPEKPWILFIHGFPSTSFDWRNQIEYFTTRGYGVIAPDLLGYGGTDKPHDLERFALKAMVKELMQLLDCEGIDKVFAVGHDFGSVVLSRVTSYASDRLRGAAFVGVGYAAPPLAFNQAGVEIANNATLKSLGYPAFGYWYFMNSDDVAPIMDANMDSAFTLTYTDTPEYMREHFSPVGRYKQWLLDGRIAPWTKYLEPDAKSIFKRITLFNGGFDGPVKSYKSLMRDINLSDEKVLKKKTIDGPVLLLTATNDPVAIPDGQIKNTEPFAKNIRIKSINAGHFLQVEQPYQVSKQIQLFVDDVLGSTFP
ncbi:Epoxide hydrolase-like [Fusarium oxysporum f. sp. vasinfectum]|uniref:AB hydrolase-1 domain-containing protein n=1 Tax=Fusarium oxysporum f. sp. vasinfectum 25433 TaxID=1089449 RepID=X0KJP2_FUSOX|nr:hypothetical protein FOTG_17736 [Fusarium oxysporum f. sp. vasinfectum 25433]KAK2675166.1 Epoxide hydrolase-like [Fusarium oxysporum f. sp. vasinfectum]KAK2680463.1 Epoxide hydrolase-like [Fusarium oxysporum f. sp. vasinfectum]KAK2931594.1 Epoxide hydrolase-like [Fusarium oxysporum f. sp. vasinfectum]